MGGSTPGRAMNDRSALPLQWPSLPAWQTPGADGGVTLTAMLAELATFGAYAAIPLLILYFLARRRHLAFSRVWFLLLAFMVIGAIVHLLDGSALWSPS